WRVAGRGRLLVDPRAEPLDGAGQPAHQLAGVDRRAIGVVERGDRAAHPHPRLRLFLTQQFVAVGEAALAHRLVAAHHALKLMPATRQAQRTTLLIVAVDLLALGDIADLVHRGHHLAVDLAGRTGAEAALQLADADWEAGRAPAAVAARRPEAGDLLLDDRHVQARVTL